MSNTSKFPDAVRALAGTLVLVAAWQAASVVVSTNLFVPQPLAVLEAGLEMLTAGRFLSDTAFTVAAWSAGMFLSILLGAPLGLVMGLSPRLRAYAGFSVSFFRAIPPSALFFLFVFAFGLGMQTEVAVVVFGCVFVVAVGALQGMLPSKERTQRLEIARHYHMPALHRVALIQIPGAMPEITTAIRIAAGLALVLATVTEMFLGSAQGLGRQLYDAYLTYQVPTMYALIIWLGFLGLSLNSLIGVVELKVHSWTTQER